VFLCLTSLLFWVQTEVQLLMGLFERVIKTELENFMRLEIATPISLHGYDSPCDHVLGLPQLLFAVTK